MEGSFGAVILKKFVPGFGGGFAVEITGRSRYRQRGNVFCCEVRWYHDRFVLIGRIGFFRVGNVRAGKVSIGEIRKCTSEISEYANAPATERQCREVRGVRSTTGTVCVV